VVIGQALEAELGLKLFNRQSQGLVITEAGRSYLAPCGMRSTGLPAASDKRLLRRQNTGVLPQARRPIYSQGLVHRLKPVRRGASAIDLRVSASLHHIDFARQDIDPPFGTQ
jgi:LysR family glycine cleavage system transcriptional activator